MLVNVNPWGLEVVITTLAAFIIYAWNDDRRRQFDYELANLPAVTWAW